MKKIFFHYFLVTVLLSTISCRKANPASPDNSDNPVDSTDNPVTRDSGKYTNGFFVLNNSTDSTARDVAFYSYDKDSLLLSGYRKENPGKSLGSLQTASLGYGTIYQNKLYMVIRNGPVLIVNPSTLKEITRINNTATMDARVFLE
jgi:hypothetical protein